VHGTADPVDGRGIGAAVVVFTQDPADERGIVHSQAGPLTW
jgi:hypothetical protein